MGGITTIINKVKYVGIASLTIAILSVLILNLISSYSNSHIQSKAEPISNSNANANLSVLANSNDSSICNPSNTNAASCISLSITSFSSSTDSNNPNLSLQIPREGGIAVGRHTVSVSSNNVTGYYVTLTGNAGSPAMVPSTPTSQAFIQSTTGTLTSPSPLAKGQWGSWGIALPNSPLYPGFNTNEADYNSTNQDTLAKTTWAAVPGKEADDNTKTIVKTTTSSKKTDTYPVYYGVMVDNPVSVPADTYTTEVVYTATTNEVEKPTITSIDHNQYELGSNTNLDSNNRLPITITGTNLKSTYKVYLENNTDSSKRYDITGENITSVTDTQLKLTLPTDITNSDLEPGEYTIHVVTQGGEDGIGFTYNDQINSVAVDYGDGVGHVQVDYDKNMIPIIYDESASTWRVVTDAQLEESADSWFNYNGGYNSSGRRWANALTVSTYSLPFFRNKQSGVDPDTSIVTANNPDILGYWVYIPRYAYKAQRRDASNSEVSAQNFDIVFETNSDPVKQPIECNTGDYQTCVKNQYGESALNYPNTTSQDDQLNNQTAWATHPAFTWKYTQAINGFDQTTELNGFWIGKFETTGTRTAPTVKPNQHANVSEYIGEFYSAAKSIGVDDPNNKYGGANYDDTTSGLTPNSHHLTALTSHMLKNSEWGAVVYLSASRYGAGVNNVKNNAAYLADGSTDADGDLSSYGATGCGLAVSGTDGNYDAGALSATTIESSTACGYTTSAYNGSLGVLASTTNNVYGVYDMGGGVLEYVMGNYAGDDLSQSGGRTAYMATATRLPYADLYNIINNSSCTWNTNGSGCGGHALFETAYWGGDQSNFVNSSLSWFIRGGKLGGGPSGVFASDYDDGYTYSDRGFRVALLVNT